MLYHGVESEFAGNIGMNFSTDMGVRCESCVMVLTFFELWAWMLLLSEKKNSCYKTAVTASCVCKFLLLLM